VPTPLTSASATASAGGGVPAGGANTGGGGSIGGADVAMVAGGSAVALASAGLGLLAYRRYRKTTA
jgi:hypothetical protein